VGQSTRRRETDDGSIVGLLIYGILVVSRPGRVSVDARISANIVPS
jgi:hypothetical protein